MRTESRTATEFTRSPRLWLALLVIATALMLAACGAANGDSAGKDDDAAQTKAAAVPVEVVTTQRAEMAAVYTGTAPVESERKAFVMPKVKGEIRAVLADEGQRVRAGQTSRGSTATSCGSKSRSTRRPCASSSATTREISSCSRKA